MPWWCAVQFFDAAVLAKSIRPTMAGDIRIEPIEIIPAAAGVSSAGFFSWLTARHASS